MASDALANDDFSPGRTYSLLAGESVSLNAKITNYFSMNRHPIDLISVDRVAHLSVSSLCSTIRSFGYILPLYRRFNIPFPQFNRAAVCSLQRDFPSFCKYIIVAV